MTIPETTGRKQDGTFAAGISGNPSGRPKGARHKATMAAMTLLEGESEALTRRAIELALSGDTPALKLCLDRIAPALKAVAPPVVLKGPVPETLGETAKALIVAAASGHMPPDIAAQMLSAIANAARVEEMATLKERLEALERALNIR